MKPIGRNKNTRLANVPTFPLLLQPSYVLSINLKRLQSFQKRAGSWQSFIIPYNGTHGESINIEEWQKTKRLSETNTLSRGQIGCFNSHYCLWKQIIEQNQITCIIEDDCNLFPSPYLASQIHQLFYLIKHHHLSWDILYLSYNPVGRRVKLLRQCPFLGIPQGHREFFCYLLTPAGAKCLVENSLPISMPCDVLAGKLHTENKLRALCAVPPLMNVVPTISDTARIK